MFSLGNGVGSKMVCMHSALASGQFPGKVKGCRKGRMKVSHLEAALSHEAGPPVIGQEFAASSGIQLRQHGGIFVHSHPEEFQVNRDWQIFWSERNLLVECLQRL